MPMHFLGLNGMPRRISDYPDGYAAWNYYMTYGSILTVISVFLFLYIVSSTIFVNKVFITSPQSLRRFN